MISVMTGYCVFCGEPQIVSASADLNQRAADIRATANCGCADAIRARDGILARQACAAVLDADGVGADIRGETADTIMALVQCVAGGAIVQATIALADDSRVIMRVGAAGLEVKRVTRRTRKVQAGADVDNAKAETTILRGLDRMIPMRAADRAEKEAQCDAADVDTDM